MAGQKSLGERTRKILEDLAERMIPSGGPGYPGSRDIGLVDRLVEMTDKFRFGLFGLKVMAWAWELMPLLSLNFKMLTRMTPEQQLRYFEGLENSRFMMKRWSLVGLKAIFMAVFYNQPAIWDKIGYKPGDCYGQAADARKS